jgi:hypothetical protein
MYFLPLWCAADQNSLFLSRIAPRAFENIKENMDGIVEESKEKGKYSALKKQRRHLAACLIGVLLHKLHT